MSDERTKPAQSDDAGEEPTAASNDRLVARPRAALSGKSVGWWFVWIVLVVVVVAVGRFVYMMQITLYPDSGPEGFKVRRIASAAEKHLSKDPNVVSVTVIEASADIGGTEADLDVRLKDDTSADAVADLLASTHDAAFGKDNSDTHITLNIVLIWTLHGTDVKFLSSSPPRPQTAQSSNATWPLRARPQPSTTPISTTGRSPRSPPPWRNQVPRTPPRLSP